MARPIREIGIDRDKVGHANILDVAADRNHLPAELVSWDDRVVSRRDVAIEQMQIRTADAGRLDLEDHV